MTPQRKRILCQRVSTTAIELTTTIVKMDFVDAPAVNIHGVNITMGWSPFGPDETLVGRWYVLNLPPSIAGGVTLLNQWLANLATISLANDFTDSNEFIWGSGSVVCAEQSTFQHTFSPKTSRNMKKDSSLLVVFVADAISGVIDNWDGAATISLFSST